MSNFWNCICQPAQAKYAIDELLRQVCFVGWAAGGRVCCACSSRLLWPPRRHLLAFVLSLVLSHTLTQSLQWCAVERSF